MEFTPRLIFATLLAILGMAGAAVCFKYAADLWDQSQSQAVMILIGGAVISILHPVGVTMALPGRNPNVVFATIGGPGIVTTHILLALIFRHPLAWWHWLAISGIIAGIALLQPERREVKP